MFSLMLRYMLLTESFWLSLWNISNLCEMAFGTGDLGVLLTHETSPCLGDAGSTRTASTSK